MSLRPVNVIETIQVPWTPYGIAISPSGQRIAIGGGTWYGHGGIVIRSLAGEKELRLNWRDLLDERSLFSARQAAHIRADPNLLSCPSIPIGIPAVSGVYFSDDDRFLAASMWGPCWTYAPTAIFEGSDNELRLRQAFVGARPSHCCHTGVLLHDGYVITRRHCIGREAADPLLIQQLPPEWRVPTNGHGRQATSRAVVRRGSAITAANPSNARCLVARALDGSAPLEIEVSDARGVSSICAGVDDDFFSGGPDGEIDRWKWDQGWHQIRVRGRQAGHAQSKAVVGLVVTAAGRLVAIEQSGTLIVDVCGEASAMTVSQPGRLRSIAAHPEREVVAVGIKGGGFSSPPSEVALVDLD
jgi:hypothetical protein